MVPVFLRKHVIFQGVEVWTPCTPLDPPMLPLKYHKLQIVDLIMLGFERCERKCLKNLVPCFDPYKGNKSDYSVLSTFKNYLP